MQDKSVPLDLIYTFIAHIIAGKSKRLLVSSSFLRSSTITDVTYSATLARVIVIYFLVIILFLFSITFMRKLIWSVSLYSSPHRSA